MFTSASQEWSRTSLGAGALPVGGRHNFLALGIALLAHLWDWHFRVGALSLFPEWTSHWQFGLFIVVSASMSGLRAGALPVGRRHTLWTLDTFTFCRKCGAYTSEKVRYLSFQCDVPTRSMGFSLSRLMAGLHPAFGTHIGQPRPLGWLPLPAILDPIPLVDEGEVDGC